MQHIKKDNGKNWRIVIKDIKSFINLVDSIIKQKNKIKKNSEKVKSSFLFLGDRLMKKTKNKYMLLKSFALFVIILLLWACLIMSFSDSLINSPRITPWKLHLMKYLWQLHNLNALINHRVIINLFGIVQGVNLFNVWAFQMIQQTKNIFINSPAMFKYKQDLKEHKRNISYSLKNFVNIFSFNPS